MRWWSPISIDCVAKVFVFLSIFAQLLAHNAHIQLLICSYKITEYLVSTARFYSPPI